MTMPTVVAQPSQSKLSLVNPAPAAGPRARRATDRERAPISLLVADSYAAARAGVRSAVEPYGFLVVAEAGDAAAAITAAQAERPRICLLATDLPGGGLDAARSIAEKVPETTIVILGENTSDESLVAAVESGASGYLPRSAAASRLPEALNAALDGYVSLPLPLLTRVVQRTERSRGSFALPGLPAVRFTPREREVLDALVSGASTAAIAARLDVSPVTVRRYASDILRKAGVSHRDELRELLRRGSPE